VRITVPLNCPSDVTVIIGPKLVVLFLVTLTEVGFALIEKSRTFSVKLCVALLPTPLWAVIVME
jgi:hypothetical protein